MEQWCMITNDGEHFSVTRSTTPSIFFSDRWTVLNKRRAPWFLSEQQQLSLNMRGIPGTLGSVALCLIWQHYSNNTLQFSLACQILCNKLRMWMAANQRLKSSQMCEVYEPFYFLLATKCGGGEENIIHFSLMEEAHTARIFTQAKQKQLHGRVKANLIGFNSERGWRGEGGEGQLKTAPFLCAAGRPYNCRRRDTMMLVITFEGHKTNRPFRNQDPGFSNQMKAKGSNPSIKEGKWASVVIHLDPHRRAWVAHVTQSSDAIWTQ